MKKKILLLAEKHYFKSLHTKYIMQPDSSRKTYRHIYGSLYYQNKIDDYLKFSSNFQHKVRKEKNRYLFLKEPTLMSIKVNRWHALCDKS